jgi:hypothetical protein
MAFPCVLVQAYAKASYIPLDSSIEDSMHLHSTEYCTYARPSIIAQVHPVLINEAPAARCFLNSSGCISNGSLQFCICRRTYSVEFGNLKPSMIQMQVCRPSVGVCTKLPMETPSPMIARDMPA